MKCKGCNKDLSKECLAIHESWCTGNFIEEHAERLGRIHEASRTAGYRKKNGVLRYGMFTMKDLENIDKAYRRTL